MKLLLPLIFAEFALKFIRLSFLVLINVFRLLFVEMRFVINDIFISLSNSKRLVKIIIFYIVSIRIQ